MGKKTNVAIIIETLTGGGAERVAGLLSFFLSEKYSVFVFVKNDKCITYKYGGNLVSLGDDNIYSSLMKAKKHYCIDCAISFSETMNYANLRTKRSETVIISHRNTTDIKTQNIPMIKKYYHYADAIVACSEGCKKLLINNAGLDPDRVFTIMNFLNDSVVDYNALDENCIDKYGEYILAVGRLTWEKDYKYLIEQFVKYKRKNTNRIKLLIIGSGPLENELRGLIKAANAEDYIFIISYTSEIGMYYKEAKAFVMTSITEGYPNVLLDALIYGLPIIATDCVSGPREILNDDDDYTIQTSNVKIAKRGVLIPTSDSDCSHDYLVKALELLLFNKSLIGEFQDSANEFIKNYSNSKICENWERVITFAKGSPQADKLMEQDYYDEIKRAKVVIIYGAGKCGEVVSRNKELFGKRIVFAVSEEKEGKKEGVPITTINKLVKYKNDAVVLLASYYERYRAEMIENAIKLGFNKIYLAHL